MRPMRPRRPLVLSLAAVLAAGIPAVASMLHAQVVIVCYVEWCIPKGTGESCVVKPVPCPPEDPA